MDDDLNIGVALASLFDFVREVNNLLSGNMLSKKEAEEVYNLILRFDNVLGVVGQVREKEKLPEGAEELIRKREDERKVGHWKEADRIREELKAMGVMIEDTAQGTKWKIEKH